MLKNILFISMLFIASQTIAQQTAKELTVSYDATVTKKDTIPAGIDMYNGAVLTVYFKGKDFSYEQVFSNNQQRTIYTAATNSSVVLRHFGNSKKVIYPSEASQKLVNSKYDTLKYMAGTETKTIAGYLCKQVKARMSDGTTITIFYTNAIACDNKNFEPMFIRLNGFPLSYKIETSRFSISYDASLVKQGPVPADKFEIPAGYEN